MTRADILVVNAGSDSLSRRVKAAIGECHQVESVPSAEKAIDLIKKKRFDLLITEIEAPACAGLRLAERVRRGDPVLAMVLVGECQGIERAVQKLQPGPQAFIAPRFAPSKLRRAVEDALERRQLMRDNRRLKALLPLLKPLSVRPSSCLPARRPRLSST